MASLRAALCAITLLLCASRSGAQDLPDVAQGLQPYVGFHGGELDKVNTLNGGLNIRIPLVSYPQKGSLALSYSVIFNSNGFQDLVECIAGDSPVGGNPQPLPLRNGCTDQIQVIPTGVPGTFPMGPRLIADQTLQAAGTYQIINPSVTQSPWSGRFYVISADNSEHPLGSAGVNEYRSINEDGYAFVPTSTPEVGVNLGAPENAFAGDTNVVLTPAAGTITDSHGNIYTSTSITDTDGNTISIPDGGTSGGFPATDSVGRQIPAPVSVSTSETAAPGPCPSITSAPAASEASSWTVPGPGGTVSYLFCYTTVAISTDIPLVSGGGSKQYSSSQSMLQSIVLPNGTFWGFVYDSNGNVVTLIYPTGGSVNYTYALSGGFCAVARPSGDNTAGATIIPYKAQVMSRTMEDAKGNVLGKWTYTYPTFASTLFTGSILSSAGEYTVTKYVSDPSFNIQVTGNNGSCSYLDGGQSVYQGTSASGKLLRTITKTYTSASANAGIPQLPIASDARENLTTTVWPNGGTSTVQKTWNGTLDFGAMQCNYQGQDCVNGGSYALTIGGPTLTTYTDYGGTVLKQDSTSYEWQANSAYLAANLIDIPAMTQTLNGSGSTVFSSTNYTYDESTYSPGGTRGDPTTVKKVINGSTSTTTHTGWNSAGMKAYIIDANGSANSQLLNTNGHTVDYQYTNTSAGCNGSVVTSTVNALNQSVSGSYDCPSGQLNLFTDANLQSTNLSWDGMERLLSVSYPDGGSIGYTYKDAANTVIRLVTATPDPSQRTTVVFDGFGREIHRYINDGQTLDTVDTNYDADGRVFQVTNPYRTTSDPTYGITTYNYDALSRKTVQKNPDMTTKQWCYNDVAINSQTNCNAHAVSSTGNWVDVTDENGNDWQQTSDSLGRLTSVAEPNGTTTAPTMETDYGYDPLNNLLSVTQWGGVSGSSGARTRSFTYDSLSRLVCASNPETSSATCPSTVPANGVYPAGATSYSYDGNGNVISKVAPAPNSPWNGGVTATTAYQYDALNRKTYELATASTAPNTFTHYFYYDLPSLFGITFTNPTGHLSVDVASFSGTPQSVAYVSMNSGHDAMGRVTEMNICTPSTCNSTNVADSTFRALNYTYDLAGNTISYTDGFGTTVSPSYDQVGRLNSVTTTGNGTTSSGTVWTANSYGPVGLTQATFGSNSAVENLQYTNRLALSSSSITNSSGTLYSENLGYYQNLSLQTANDSVNGNWTYTNDTLNRLTTAVSSTAAEGCQFSYDAFGNRTQEAPYGTSSSGTGNSCFTENLTLSAPTNQIAGYCYDAAGNLLDPYPCPASGIRNQYLYDAYGNLLTPNFNSSDVASYTVDALGQRVAKFSGSTMTNQYLYDKDGGVVAEMDGSGNWIRTNVRAGGQFLAELQGSITYFRLNDHLGTIRVELGSNGCESTFTNLPFGDGLTTVLNGCADETEHHFTGKERDTESGNDYFGARYYASSVGRFLSPDAPVDQHPNNPQSWNLYTYVRNNPLGGVDPDGNFDCGALTAAQCTQVGTNLTTAQRQLDTAWTNGTITDNQYLTGSAAIFAYGTMNDHNGVTVNVGETQDNAPAMTNASQGGKITAANPTGQDIQVTFRPGFLESANSDTTAQVTGHEGSHVEDAEDWAKAGYTEAARPTRFETEFRAYGVTSIFGEAQGYGILHGSMNGGQSYLFWEKIFPEPLNNALRATMIRALYPVSDAKAFKDNTKEGHQ